MIDSHAHLDDARFSEDRDAVIGRARRAGVEWMVCPATDLPGSEWLVQFAHLHRGISVAVGMDRDQAGRVSPGALAELGGLARSEDCVAIGEIGLDYHYDRVPREVQRAGFQAQIELAADLGLPVIVHCREAFDDCLDLLGRCRPRGVMHCFSGDAETVSRCCELGLMVSFSGTVTFKGAEGLREAARSVPVEHLMVETDCPYLAPQAVRGQRNEPAFVAHVVRCLAGVLGRSEQEVDRITSENARRLFGLGAAD